MEQPATFLSLSEIIEKFEMTPTATKSHTGVSGSEVECSNLTEGTALSKILSSAYYWFNPGRPVQT